MRVLSSYLIKNVDGIDIWPMTMIMAEFANIAEGGEAEFIKSKESKPGQPIDPLYNLQQASLIASIEILMRNGFELSDAFRQLRCRSLLA